MQASGPLLSSLAELMSLIFSLQLIDKHRIQAKMLTIRLSMFYIEVHVLYVLTLATGDGSKQETVFTQGNTCTVMTVRYQMSCDRCT